MKILIINGSHRKGNTDNIVESVLSELKVHEVETRHLILRNIQMELPDGCEICAESGICPHIHDQFSQEVEPSIRDYDVYILATPVWSDGITPLSKIFWDRIVSWCHKDRMYLKNKKLAMVVHGMADEKSWQLAIDWLTGVCSWEGATFAGSLRIKTGSKVDNYQIDQKSLKEFITKITS